MYAVKSVEDSLKNIGWDVQIPTDTYRGPHIIDVVLDILQIPEEGTPFIRDMYFDVLLENNDPLSAYEALVKLAEDNRAEYLEEGLALPTYE